MKFPTALVTSAAAGLLLSGCGSIHVFDESHTHIDTRRQIITDDPNVSRLASLINRIKAMNEPQEEPLPGFNWDERILVQYEGDKTDE